MFSGAGRIESYYWPDLQDRDYELATNGYVGGTTGAFVTFNCRTRTTGRRGRGSGSNGEDLDRADSLVQLVTIASWGPRPTTGARKGPSRSSPLGIGDELHTFYGTAGGKTLIVQFHSHIDANGCSFAATSQGTGNLDH